MDCTEKILQRIVKRFKEQGYTQVDGYNRFGFVREYGNGVIVSRERGKDTRIQYKHIKCGIEAVRNDHSVYSGGPSKLRNYGLTHITSPVWSLLHLVPLDDYR